MTSFCKKTLHYHVSKATWHGIRGLKTHLLHSFLLWHLRAFFFTVKAYSQRQNNLKKKVKFEFSKNKKWPNWPGKHISLKMEMSKVWLHNKICWKSFLKNFGTFSSGPKNVHIHWRQEVISWTKNSSKFGHIPVIILHAPFFFFAK